MGGLILLMGLLQMACTQDDRPRRVSVAGRTVPVDTVYQAISPIAEELVDPADIPSRLSVAEWRADLDTLAARVQRRLPYARAATGDNHFTQRLDSLKRMLPRQTRDQRILSVFRLLNLPATGTGHTGVDPDQRALGWRVVPVRPYRFADGAYIMAAADTSLIGQDIVSMGGVPIDSVYAALAPYVSADNRWGRRGSTRLINYAHPLRALGIVDSVAAVSMQVPPRSCPST